MVTTDAGRAAMQAAIQEVQEAGSIGAMLIASERARQQQREARTAEHDRRWRHGELLRAALSYLAPGPRTQRWPPDSWPWEAEAWKPTPKDRVRELVKAGALIAAEIDRLEALAERGEGDAP